MSLPAKQFYDFSPFRLDLAEGVLLRDGKPVSITPKAFELLRVLVENHGHILSKEYLLRQVWPDTFVEEGNLPFNVSQLRKALGQAGIALPAQRTEVTLQNMDWLRDAAAAYASAAHAGAANGNGSAAPRPSPARLKA